MYVQYSGMNKATIILLLTCLMVPFSGYGIEDGILRVSTWERDEAEVRALLAEAFMDIIDSPTIVSMNGYLEIELLRNKFITNKTCYAAIYLQQTDDKLMISAIPFTYVGNKRIMISDYSVHRGVFLIVEGVGKALDYPYEMRNHGLVKESSWLNKMISFDKVGK